MTGSLLLTSVQMSFQLASLKFLPGLQHFDGTLMDPMWNNYHKLHLFWQSLWQNPNEATSRKELKDVRSLSSRFVGPKPMDFQAFFSLSQNSSLCSTLPP